MLFHGQNIYFTYTFINFSGAVREFQMQIWGVFHERIVLSSGRRLKFFENFHVWVWSQVKNKEFSIRFHPHITFKFVWSEGISPSPIKRTTFLRLRLDFLDFFWGTYFLVENIAYIFHAHSFHFHEWKIHMRVFHVQKCFFTDSFKIFSRTCWMFHSQKFKKIHGSEYFLHVREKDWFGWWKMENYPKPKYSNW